MSFVVRMSILGTLLVVALVGLAWEYLVAVPGFNNAQEKLSKLSDENIKLTAEEAKTMADVKKVISKSPSESKMVAPKKKESTDDKTMRAMFFLRQDKYNFYHALPWKKPETITVVYKRPLQSDADVELKPESFEDTEWIFWSVHFNQEVPPTYERSVSKDAVNPGDTPAAMGGGPSSLPTVRSAESIFDQRDVDKDGKLVGEEIPSNFAQRMDSIDTDKNGEISLEELKTFMPTVSGAKARESKNKGEGKGAQKGKRPETDDKADEKKADPEKKEAEKKVEEKKVEEKKEAEAEKKVEEKKDDKADAKK